MKTRPAWEPIPGETPIDDVSGLIPTNVGTRTQLNQVEAENITLAMTKYLVGRLSDRDAPFSYQWFFDLHGEMFGNVWKWAGKARTYNVNFGCPFYDIGAKVMDLVQDIVYWGKGPFPLIEDAAQLHYRAVKIHPFQNGNGRWSRLLANIWLRRHGAKPIQWPENLIGEVSPIRNEYLEAIKAADKNEFQLLNDLHRRFAPE